MEHAIRTSLATGLDSLNDRLRRPNDADTPYFGMPEEYYKCSQ